MSSYRPRRTRIYGANYDIGESYYKKQLESLGNKNVNNRLSDQPLKIDESSRENFKFPSKVSFLESDADLFKSAPKKLFHLKIAEDIGDLKSSNTITGTYAPMPLVNHISDDFEYGDNLQSSSRISRKSRNITSDVKTSFLSDLENEVKDKFSSRRLKLRDNLFIEDESADVKAASSRMKATKARLADLETEMLSITEKQSEREKRNSKLKKLLNDADSDIV